MRFIIGGLIFDFVGDFRLAPQGHFLRSRCGATLPKGMDKVMRRSCPRSGVKVMLFNGSPNTFATIVTNRHGVAKATKLLAHADIKTTMIYYHEDQQVLQAVVEDL
jgi:hypothetical protein